MQLTLRGHQFRYECENLCRLFFPYSPVKVNAPDTAVRGEPWALARIEERDGQYEYTVEAWDSLGGNELFIRHPERRAECIDRIMEKIGGIPFIWIGPPNWQKDTGINRVIRSCTGEYRFFDSSDMKLQRSDDGKHPTRYAARIWMDSIASWMRTRHDLTLRMDKPGKGIKSNTDIIIIAAKP